MKTITIGKVEIPTRSYAIGGTALLGIRGSGKTVTAKGIAEQLIRQGVPIIVFDAIGVWRYLKVPAKRGGDGFPIVVAGGKGADLPLTVASAPEIVRAAIRENVNLVIDLYDRTLSKADWRRIVQACFRTLLYENQGVRHIFLEEAAEYIPQRVADGETYAEVEKVARMGGNASLGLTLINQRAQEVNKAVLDLCENLVLMRQRGAHAIEALEKWIDKVSPDFAKRISADMPSMGPGEAWVFAGDAEEPARVKVPMNSTYHPDRRHPDVQPAGSPADTGKFVEAMRGALPKLAAEAEARDPAKLRARVAELERQLQISQQAAGAAQTGRSTEDRQAWQEKVKAAEERGRARGHAQGVREALRLHRETGARVLAAVKEALAVEPGVPDVPPVDVTPVYTGFLQGKNHGQTSPRRRQSAPAPRGNGASHDGEPLTGPEQRILDAIAWLESTSGRPDAEQTAVAFLAGYTYGGGAFNNPRGRLNVRGLVEYRGDRIALTDAGRAMANVPEAALTADELHRRVMARLPGPEQRILRPLLEAYPNAMDGPDVARAANYTHGAGAFNNPRGRLRSLGLIEYVGGQLRASDALFPA